MKEIRSFSDLETELIYKGIRSKKLPFEIQKIAISLKRGRRKCQNYGLLLIINYLIYILV